MSEQAAKILGMKDVVLTSAVKSGERCPLFYYNQTPLTSVLAVERTKLAAAATRQALHERSICLAYTGTQKI